MNLPKDHQLQGNTATSRTKNEMVLNRAHQYSDAKSIGLSLLPLELLLLCRELKSQCDGKAYSLVHGVGLISEDASACSHPLLPLLELHCCCSSQHLYDSYLALLLPLEPESMIKLLLRFLEYCCSLRRNKKQMEENKAGYLFLLSNFLPVFPCGRT